MSKLPNAPLVEVIFEIRWDTNDKATLDKFQLLIGAMFSELKMSFPNAITLRPDAAIPIEAFVGTPTHRFTSETGYPMYQLGPGILSVNMTDSDYVWESFIETIQKVSQAFESLSELQGKTFKVALKYLDFFKCDFSIVDLPKYLETKFHLSVSAPYLSKIIAKTFSFATSSHVDEGNFILTMNTGYNNVNGEQIEGIITESAITNDIFSDSLMSYIKNGLPQAHKYLGEFFKQLTAGELYDSFK